MLLRAQSMSAFVWLAIWLSSGLWLASRVLATASAPEYSIEELAVVPGASAKNLGSLNVQGYLVGGAVATDSVQRAFVAGPAGVEIIPVNLRGDYSAARGINDFGEIVGSYNIGGAMRGFRWSATGGARDLPPLRGDSSSEASDVNRNGEAVGNSSGPLGIRAVRWTPDGAVQELSGLPRDAYSRALAISDRGAVVGVVGRAPSARAFVWTTAGVRDLGVLPGDQQSEALAINESGDIVGWSRGSRGTRAVLWSSGNIQDLGALREHSNFTRARAINARGEVVGDSIADHNSRAFIWTIDAGMRDLNDLIAPGWPYLLVEAVAINDRGHIIAVGHGNDYIHDAEGQGGPSVRVFVLSPGRARPSAPRADVRRRSAAINYDYCGVAVPVAGPATFFRRGMSANEWGTMGML